MKYIFVIGSFFILQNSALANLNCKQPGDAIEYNICRNTKADTCEELAGLAVEQWGYIRHGAKEIHVAHVRAIQEDATYLVTYTVAGQVNEIARQSRVHVSTSPADCRIHSVILSGGK